MNLIYFYVTIAVIAISTMALGSSMGEKVNEAGQAIRDKLNEATEPTWTERASELGTRAKEKVAEAGHAVRDKLMGEPSLSQKASELGSQTFHKISEAGQSARDKLNEATEPTWTDRAKEAAQSVGDKVKKAVGAE